MLTLVPSILAYCLNSTFEYLQKCTKETAIGGSNAQVTSAIKAFIFLLPMTGKKRLTAKESFDLLITYVEPGSSINLTEKLAHPKLYIEQSADDNNQLNGSIVCDGKVCVAGFNMVECIDYLFKMFWVFSLEYPNGLEIFFKFLQYKIYLLSFGKEKTSSSVNSVDRLFQLN
ncbi:uncharacterized protein LOC136080914 [Hydra vulgaris]|uniref:Uncharacterized protein LOC136080914 n=1 Tax=Hydra vulgaris TaxID=6087 RepID=A0ABM4BYQ4_HYDVU